MEPIAADDTRGQVTRRRVISGIAGVGAAVIAGGTIARAQSTSTPEAGTDSTTDTDTDTTSPETKSAELYQTFLTKLGTELSIADTATIDTGIRNALKSMIDDIVTAGDLAVNRATELKTKIDEAASPIRLNLGGGDHGGMRQGGGRMGGVGGTKPGDSTNDEEDTDDSSVATPTT